MKGNMQCTAFDCELCSIIRGKFTGLVCILNTCRRRSSQLWERLKRQRFQSGVWRSLENIHTLMRARRIYCALDTATMSFPSSNTTNAQQIEVETRKIPLLHCLHIWVMWERYSGAIRGQTRLLQCTKITHARREQKREIRSELLRVVWCSEWYHTLQFALLSACHAQC